jgi:hypothetical protein
MVVPRTSIQVVEAAMSSLAGTAFRLICSGLHMSTAVYQAADLVRCHAVHPVLHAFLAVACVNAEAWTMCLNLRDLFLYSVRLAPTLRRDATHRGVDLARGWGACRQASPSPPGVSEILMTGEYLTTHAALRPPTGTRRVLGPTELQVQIPCFVPCTNSPDYEGFRSLQVTPSDPGDFRLALIALSSP